MDSGRALTFAFAPQGGERGMVKTERGQRKGDRRSEYGRPYRAFMPASSALAGYVESFGWRERRVIWFKSESAPLANRSFGLALGLEFMMR